MPLEFRFPDVGEGVVEGEIRRWLVREGDHVKADQPLVEVETDKALVELPAPRAGTILKIAAGQGETVRVGQVIVVIGDAGESLPAGEQARRQSSTIVGDLEGTPHELTLDRAETPRAPAAKGKVRAIPAVRKLAQELGVNLDEVRGSGPDGRVLHEDVVRAAQRGSQAGTTAPTVADDAEIERVPMPRLRRTIALAMVQSKFTAPHATTHDEGDVHDLMALVARQRADFQRQGVHLTPLPYVIKAVVQGLKVEPYMNASLDMEAGVILLRKRYHIGIGTDTPEGLIVTVVRDADRKSIIDLAREIAELTERAKNRTASIQELTGSTFTISNYGAFGGNFGTPIINPPEVAVLGVGRAREKPVVRDGQIVIRTLLPLSLSFDHRLIDGGISTRFLLKVMACLEEPERLS